MEGRICWVVVLGDFGRSPRMQYHTSSLLKRGAIVHVLAYDESNLISFLVKHSKLTHHAIPPPPKCLQAMPRILALILKALFQLLFLMCAMLWKLPKPDFALVQLPPSIPTVLVCWLVNAIRGVVFVFDWHNFAFTLMGLTMGEEKWLVKCAKWLEMKFGKCGAAHLCVTKAMQGELASKWGIQASVLYDRPPDFFRAASNRELHDLMGKMAPVLNDSMHYGDFCKEMLPEIVSCEGLGNGEVAETMFTEIDEGGNVVLKPNRPAIVVSSTSWTPDEDFSILLEAACAYNKKADQLSESEGTPLAKLLFIVTGKGPMKDFYMEKMRGLDVRHVAFRTVWLEPDDYPKLLGCADLGISLHRSSSNLDLPMKIVDMYGCSLPVCAVGYSCLHELVEDGKTGLVFSTSQELGDMLVELFKGFPHRDDDQPLLAKFRRTIGSRQGFSWEKNWEQCGLPVFEGVLRKKCSSTREGGGEKLARKAL
ncbi:hypothetical protein BSKO_10066 [Bryopsis sp. KO-2023]|nr:hypothetical protein BSKO_10066 [Bryopsis sp. KO-2023]